MVRQLPRSATRGGELSNKENAGERARESGLRELGGSGDGLGPVDRDFRSSDDGPIRVDSQPQPTRRAPRKARPKPAVASIEELLRFAYESNARLLDLPKEVVLKLAVTDEGVGSQRELIAQLAEEDASLAVPFRLLQFVARQGINLRRSGDTDAVKVLCRLRDLSVVAMSQNPVFSAWADQLADPNREPKLPSKWFRDEAARVATSKSDRAGDGIRSGGDERLISNAVACYLLLRAIQREWTTDRYIDESFESVWEPEVPRGATRERIAGVIAASRDHDVLGLVATHYRSRIDLLDQSVAETQRQLDAAARRESRLREQARDSLAKIEAANAKSDAYSTDIVRLQKELAAERDHRVVDQSHMADDYETLRTRIIRRLSGEIDLLTDGLHALRNGSPNVAEEFLDRSLLALSRELEQLKDATGGLE